MAEINVNDHLSTPINPGNSVDVTIVFDVPVDTVPAALELHDSMFSGGAKVALR
ncbi:Telomeric repeat-binding factor 2 [Nocardia cyriacigeorgica]|uniref:Telomeric repeat-binding factor 2 n=1 Tax=Nocardia cyriacigeorgica TaxID=135487 RepID=A0A4U8VW48_9NOCA|nr:Telomeric repeat-binding factor 2 [Nocardia cyriacigeorgica]